MKRYIATRSPFRKQIEGRAITPFDAGRDFLRAILLSLKAELSVGDEEIALTVPVDALEHYEDWLTEVVSGAAFPRYRIIDEPSAAALGYGTHIQPGDVYLLFDFGGGTLDAAVVLIEEERRAITGRRCRVLGKSGDDIGGSTIDQWLFLEVLKRTGRSDAEDEVRQVSNAILVECEQAKVRLSSYDRAEVTVVNPMTGAALAAQFTRGQFEDILDEKDVYHRISRAIRKSLNEAHERGFKEDQVKSVLMVGGTSLIPSVQRTVQQVMGRERVQVARPLDAVARGAAAFVAGVDFLDHIHHDYTIRSINPREGRYEYTTIVKRGTPYPTVEPVLRRRVKATYDGQTHLGLAIFEMTEPHRHREGQPVELVFDLSGAARVTHVTPDEEERRSHFWMNEGNPTFLVADPPARQREPRFEVEFGIDANKRLLLSARDLRTGKLTYRNYPVVKLT